nr:HNH endonuclease signature motif containing protein [uncultured Pedobacter sp.]
MSRPRVRPVNSTTFPDAIRVEFPRSLREQHAIGTRFRADLKVSQKTEKATGQLKGPPYLVADTNTIEVLYSFVSNLKLRAIKLNTVSNRVYRYVNDGFSATPSFNQLRNKAYSGIQENPKRYDTTSSTSIARSQLIVAYALSRANGSCEGCEELAPFLRVNGEPYLEVHHIEELANNGSDSPINVIALCPNCHRRVTFGQDRQEYNDLLRFKIKEFEDALTQ